MFENNFSHLDEDLSIFDLYYRKASVIRPDSNSGELKLNSGRKSIIKESALAILDF